MKLVDDAKKAWKWFSMQMMALAVIVQTAWAAIPPDMKAGIPVGLVTGLTIALLILGIGGRVVKQGKGDE